MERIAKVIAQSGFCSRRKAEELIDQKRVKVDGELVLEKGFKVTNKNKVYIDDKLINAEDKEYYLLNKPRGVICTTNDENGRNIITSLIDTDKRIFPVGRLDYDTTGLIILTNDGDLSNILTSSKNDIEKVYIAKVNGMVTPDMIYKLKNGVVIDKIKTKRAKVKVKKYDKIKNISIVEITITEGRNHQVKNMFLKVGLKVLKLKREKLAFLNISDLKSGEYRKLNPKEVKKLYSLKK